MSVTSTRHSTNTSPGEHGKSGRSSMMDGFLSGPKAGCSNGVGARRRVRQPSRGSWAGMKTRGTTTESQTEMERLHLADDMSRDRERVRIQSSGATVTLGPSSALLKGIWQDRRDSAVRCSDPPSSSFSSSVQWNWASVRSAGVTTLLRWTPHLRKSRCHAVADTRQSSTSYIGAFSRPACTMNESLGRKFK